VTPGWLVRRIAAAIATMLAVLTLAFAAIHLAPGTPFMPRGDRPPLDAAAVARLQHQFGLDRSLPEQYGRYLASLARGELGESFSARRPVSTMIADAIPATLLLAGTALAIEFILGLAIGVWQAVHRDRRWEAAVTVITLFFYSLPTFWLGLILLLLFGERLHWFPVGGIVDPATHDALSFGSAVLDRLRHLVLPATTLGLIGAAGTARFQRPAMLAVLGQDYVRTARAKGISGAAVVWRHAVRNALLPWITLLGLALPSLLTGAVLVETVFAWPGMGKLAADAIATRDYPVVTATTLLASALVVAGSLVADLLYRAADPRLRSAT
jgi:peptide/nickel transport system permease protein